MNPWTGFLESLHSALIDELTERHPEPKPELGLPHRQNRFAIPSSEIEQVLLINVAFDVSQGIALLATQQAFVKAIQLTPPQLWNSMLRRAASEFLRRKIQPKFALAQELPASGTFLSSTLSCSRVVWIPIRIPAGQCYFGVGV